MIERGGGLARLANLAAEFGAACVADEARALAQRTAEGRFFVACVGQFKRGKSTLLNTLLGDAVLPVGVVPVTAVVTVVRHGPVRRATVNLLDGSVLEIAPERLAEYVAEEWNPANQKGVSIVELTLPSPILRGGMCLVDTPGIGSVFAANTKATRAFVPHIDAALVVLGADPPISGDELALVGYVAGHVLRTSTPAGARIRKRRGPTGVQSMKIRASLLPEFTNKPKPYLERNTGLEPATFALATRQPRTRAILVWPPVAAPVMATRKRSRLTDRSSWGRGAVRAAVRSVDRYLLPVTGGSEMMKHAILGSAALALVSIGCAHGAASQATAPSAQPRPQMQTGMGAGMAGGRMAAMCPMAVPGTQVSAAETSTGETVTFSTTSSDQVAELRTRVRAMADMHNQHHGAGGMHEGMHEHGGMMGGGAMANIPMPPPSTATVEDTDSGARLVVSPKDPAQLAQLQSAVRGHAEMMQKGGCGMMKGMQQPGGTPPSQ